MLKESYSKKEITNLLHVYGSNTSTHSRIHAFTQYIYACLVVVTEVVKTSARPYGSKSPAQRQVTLQMEAYAPKGRKWAETTNVELTVRDCRRVESSMGLVCGLMQYNRGGGGEGGHEPP